MEYLDLNEFNQLVQQLIKKKLAIPHHKLVEIYKKSTVMQKKGEANEPQMDFERLKDGLIRIMKWEFEDRLEKLKRELRDIKKQVNKPVDFDDEKAMKLKSQLQEKIPGIKKAIQALLKEDMHSDRLYKMITIDRIMLHKSWNQLA